MVEREIHTPQTLSFKVVIITVCNFGLENVFNVIGFRFQVSVFHFQIHQWPTEAVNNEQTPSMSAFTSEEEDVKVSSF